MLSSMERRKWTVNFLVAAVRGSAPALAYKTTRAGPEAARLSNCLASLRQFGFWLCLLLRRAFQRAEDGGGGLASLMPLSLNAASG